jgi:ATP-dependent Clp protease ATP-binding subunit ClpC
MERFTDRARQVLSLAQEAAEQFQYDEIEVEHVLLALIREVNGVAGVVLRELGANEARVEGIIAGMPHTSTRLAAVPPELAASTKRVLELAVEEARRMGHRYIGTEHLLLGVVQFNQRGRSEILKQIDISPQDIRKGLYEVLRGPSEENPPDKPSDDPPPPAIL